MQLQKNLILFFISALLVKANNNFNQLQARDDFLSSGGERITSNDLLKDDEAMEGLGLSEEKKIGENQVTGSQLRSTPQFNGGFNPRNIQPNNIRFPNQQRMPIQNGASMGFQPQFGGFPNIPNAGRFPGPIIRCKGSEKRCLGDKIQTCYLGNFITRECPDKQKCRKLLTFVFCR